MNAWIVAIALQQMGAGLYSIYLTNWKVGAILILVGFANLVLSTVEV